MVYLKQGIPYIFSLNDKPNYTIYKIECINLHIFYNLLGFSLNILYIASKSLNTRYLFFILIKNYVI